MTPFIVHLLQAAALGLCVAIPFGPIGLMCVQRTLAFGIWSGVASGMGAVTAHGMFSCLAVVSGTVLTQMTFALHTQLRIAGGIVLILMGLRTILVSTGAAHGGTCGDATCGDLLSAYTSTLLIAAANPMTILPYLGVTSALETGTPLIMDRALAMSIGVMLGSASWYLFLVLSTNTVFRSLQKAALDSVQQAHRNPPDGPGSFAMRPHRLTATAKNRRHRTKWLFVSMKEESAHEQKEERAMGTTLFDGRPGVAQPMDRVLRLAGRAGYPGTGRSARARRRIRAPTLLATA